ncbi:MAG TPA: metallopeptidase family protein [Rhizomicrobium sp.]|nr:metallopeptidase family protein [Rhizomicrobium sp.]
MPARNMMHPPSSDAILAAADAAFDGLPDEFRDLTGGVVFTVQDFADRETLTKMGIANPYELLGLFQGVPYAVREGYGGPLEPTMIFLYAQPIIAFWRARDDSLEDIVRHVLIHEIGHHFGLSDDDMHAIEDAAD